MTFHELIKRAEKLTLDNSPAILTALGVTGTLTTAFLTGKATLRSAEIIAEEQRRLDMHETSHPLERKEKIKLVWKEFIPPAAACVLTVVCIVGSNRIGTRRTAAMAAAYSISERAFSEYKDKVVERMGEKKERDLRDEVMQDRITSNPPTDIIVTGGGKTLCYDAYTGRYFYSEMERLKKAENDTNFQLLADGYASLSDFYHRIGLKSTSQSDELGWNVDKQLTVEYSTVLFEERLPCVAINFVVTPMRNFSRWG